MTTCAKQIKRAENIDFQKTVDRPLTPFHTDLLTLPMVDKTLYSRVIDEPFFYKNEICISGAFYDDFAILDQEEMIIEKRIQKDKKYLDERAKAIEIAGNLLIKFCITSDKLSGSSSKQQLGFIKDYIYQAESFVPWFTVVITIGNYLEQQIEYVIHDRLDDEQKIKSYAISITTPTRPSLHNLEENDFLTIAEYHKKGIKVDDLIAVHLNKYRYIGFRDGIGAFWTKNDIMRRLNKSPDPASERKKILANKKRIEKEANEIIKKLGSNGQLLSLIRHAKKYVWLRTYRSDVYSQAFALISRIMNQYVQTLGYKSGDYLQFSTQDFLQEKCPSNEELKKRKTAFAAIGINGKMDYLAGQNAITFRTFLENKVAMGKEICGTVASKIISKITGVVKIVNSEKDMAKVEPGDIIVATMTTPNFTPAMKIASGFVTDEGGILCHAAILSREMEKPCIVGTKNATRMLKDFDIIQMNMEEGTVKLILHK